MFISSLPGVFDPPSNCTTPALLPDDRVSPPASTMLVPSSTLTPGVISIDPAFPPEDAPD